MAGEQRLSPDAKMAFIALLVLAGIASAINVGIIGWLVGPICIALACFAVARAPLRYTMLALMFFALVLENPAEGPACTKWSTPFLPIGALLLQHFKSTIGFGPIGGMDVMLVTASLVQYSRRRRITGPIGTPRPMIRLAQLTFATIVFMVLVGKWRGGETSFALWQIDRVIYLPVVFLLCQAAFTQPKDYLAIGKVALAAAVTRAIMAIWVRLTVPYTVDPDTGLSSLPYATTHNDSMLFATGSVILVSLLLQRAGKKYTRIALLFGPILLGGMLANTRRIVWVEIILVLTTLYLISDTNAVKRKLNRIMLLLAPVVAGYVAVGWGSQGGIFKPVQVIRSAVDSSADASTAWRDLENFNLVFTLRQFPLTGVGYGNPFWEMWPMPEVPYDLEKYVPHNSILGLYCYGGFVGYAGLTALWVGGIYFTIRAYHHCKAPLEKSAALAGFAAILVYYFQCFGDMGLGSWTGVYLVAPAMAVGCKLTVASGAWNMAARNKRAARVFSPSQVSR
jgi:hypothetical protein